VEMRHSPLTGQFRNFGVRVDYVEKCGSFNELNVLHVSK